MTKAIKMTQRISVSALDAVRKPLAEAKGMPNAAYDDPALFEIERDHVLGKTWAGLAFASELPNKGFAKPVDFMGLPLVIMRTRSDDLKVFHNVCSHRGMILIREETEVQGVVRCPYHSWTYDLDGNLKGTPHIGGVGVHKVDGFDCANHNLKEIRSSLWLGIIFINLSSDAPEFGEFIQPLLDRWDGFTGKGGLDQIRVANTGSSMDLMIQANWKLAVENYCEAYHLPWVHPALNSYSPLNEHYNLVVNEYMSGQGTNNYNLSGVAGTQLPQFPGWPEAKIRQGEYVSLYPNLLLGLQADHVFVIILCPLANNQTLEKLEISYVGDAATGDEFAANRSAVLDSWRVVFGEDVFAVEGMQNGRKSPGFSGGVFSPILDEPTHHFHTWTANRYEAIIAAEELLV